ncbi:UNVERIFIED_CONTAM: hypothetical protein BEN50_21695, partial [Euhalothece sp. KZN 001]
SIELILLETLVLPLRTGNQNLLQAYDQLLLSSSLQLIPIHQEILRNAAQLRGDYNLKTPDAIHLATALRESCNWLLTNDVQFRRVRELSVTILQDALSDLKSLTDSVNQNCRKQKQNCACYLLQNY